MHQKKLQKFEFKIIKFMKNCHKTFVNQFVRNDKLFDKYIVEFSKFLNIILIKKNSKTRWFENSMM